jgi:ribosome-associated protein
LKTSVTPKAARATSSGTRLTRNSKLFKTIIAAIQEKKGEAIVSLDLKQIEEVVTDFMVICQAGNYVQLGAIVDNIEKQVSKQLQEKPYKIEGKRGQSWILIDYVNIVVHCFTEETRLFYNLEEMWNDADRKEHND